MNATVFLFWSSEGIRVWCSAEQKDHLCRCCLASSSELPRLSVCAPAIEGVCQVVAICYLFAPWLS